MACVTSVEHKGTRKLIVLQKTMAAPVNEPSAKPFGMESLEWLFALEIHDGDVEMASFTEVANPVRLLLDSGSGVSTCSPDFAPHVQTHTESVVRARSATGQVTKSLGKKTVNFDMNGVASSVNMDVLKISKPIMSAGKVVRSGRKIVLDDHGSYTEDKRTGTRIPVELTRGDVFEVSAHRILDTRSWTSQCRCKTGSGSAGDQGTRRARTDARAFAEVVQCQCPSQRS